MGRRAVRGTFENAGGFSSAHPFAFTADKYAPRLQVCQACKHKILCLDFRSLARCGWLEDSGNRRIRELVSWSVGEWTIRRLSADSAPIHEFTSPPIHKLLFSAGRWEGPFGRLPQCTGRASEGILSFRRKRKERGNRKSSKWGATPKLTKRPEMWRVARAREEWKAFPR
jgi:hypothetical protein